jgi:hypothetical protein
MDFTTYSTGYLDHQRAAELERRVEFARIRAERLADPRAERLADTRAERPAGAAAPPLLPASGEAVAWGDAV